MIKSSEKTRGDMKQESKSELGVNNTLALSTLQELEQEIIVFIFALQINNEIVKRYKNPRQIVNR